MADFRSLLEQRIIDEDTRVNDQLRAGTDDHGAYREDVGYLKALNWVRDNISFLLGEKAEHEGEEVNDETETDG